jgi:TPR repeat protein
MQHAVNATIKMLDEAIPGAFLCVGMHPAAMEWMGAFAQQGRGGEKDSTAAKTYYEKAAALGNEDAKAALKRLECPYKIKDKRGNFVTNLCF